MKIYISMGRKIIKFFDLIKKRGNRRGGETSKLINTTFSYYVIFLLFFKHLIIQYNSHYISNITTYQLNIMIQDIIQIAQQTSY